MNPLEDGRRLSVETGSDRVDWDVVLRRIQGNPDKRHLLYFKVGEDIYEGLISRIEVSGEEVNFHFSSVKHKNLLSDAGWQLEPPEAAYAFHRKKDRPINLGNLGTVFLIPRGGMDHAELYEADPEVVEQFLAFEESLSLSTSN